MIASDYYHIHDLISEDELAHISINPPRPAIFLDRDGVLLVEQHYLKDPDKVILEKGIIPFLNLVSYCNWPVIIVTNQSGISRGYYTWSEYHKITLTMLRKIPIPNPIISIYSNSLLTEKDDESWRKPAPGMIIHASIKFNLDLKNSILVGDRQSDIEAGLRAGIKSLVHTLTGHGTKERDSTKSYFNQYINSNTNTPSLYLIDDFESFPKELLVPDDSYPTL